MKKNAPKIITLTPIQNEILDFLSEQDPKQTLNLKKDEPLAHLILNHPESILEHLYSNPVHLAKIRNAIESDPADFESYFNGTMYLDEDMADAPFLCYIASLFKWCGCAVGIDGRMEALYQIMKAVQEKSNNEISFDQFQTKIKNEFGGDNIFCLLMDSFDSLNLFEHGGSVYSSWLSQDGQIVYKHLQEWIKNRKV